MQLVSVFGAGFRMQHTSPGPDKIMGRDRRSVRPACRRTQRERVNLAILGNLVTLRHTTGGWLQWNKLVRIRCLSNRKLAEEPLEDSVNDPSFGRSGRLGRINRLDFRPVIKGKISLGERPKVHCPAQRDQAQDEDDVGKYASRCWIHQVRSPGTVPR